MSKTDAVYYGDGLLAVFPEHENEHNNSAPWYSDFDYLVLRIHIKISTLISVLDVVLYGCETWSLTLMEEHRLRVFENRVLRRIFGPKRDEVTGGWRKLHNEELHG
jgi:hypothetical protein